MSPLCLPIALHHDPPTLSFSVVVPRQLNKLMTNVITNCVTRCWSSTHTQTFQTLIGLFTLISGTGTTGMCLSTNTSLTKERPHLKSTFLGGRAGVVVSSGWKGNGRIPGSSQNYECGLPILL